MWQAAHSSFQTSGASLGTDRRLGRLYRWRSCSSLSAKLRPANARAEVSPATATMDAIFMAHSYWTLSLQLLKSPFACAVHSRAQTSSTLRRHPFPHRKGVVGGKRV